MATVYNCIVKVANGSWITYHSVNHLAKFTKFIDTKFGEDWKFFNVYDKEDKSGNNNILASFQNGEKRNVPSTKSL